MNIKGSNLGAMPKNDKQKEWFEFRCDAREHKIKMEGIEFRRGPRKPESKQRD